MLSDLPEYKLLSEHQKKIKDQNLKELFSQDKQRASKFSLEKDELLLDYSKNHINSETIKLLFKLAEKQNLKSKIQDMFLGKKINVTEKREVLHTALRNPLCNLEIDQKKIKDLVQNELNKMINFYHDLINGNFRGSTGKKIKRIINIGIGGSHLGPQMVVNALKSYQEGIFQIDFISNVDNSDIASLLSNCDAEETLFIISSKTFTTSETMANALTAKAWISSKLGKDAIKNHFIAVSTNAEKVNEFGIDSQYIFTFWDWVGGRFSVSSTIGISILLAIGPKNFSDFLEGMHLIDQHFQNESFENNIPVIMGLIEVWYTNFFNYNSKAVIPYSQALAFFPEYLQQLQMESNGKSVSTSGEKVTWDTSPVIWGSPGTNGQHAYFQFLHQGTQVVPVEFIGFAKAQFEFAQEQHELLMANLFAQSKALAFGKSREIVEKEEKNTSLVPHKVFDGNRPSSTLLLKEISPKELGKLIAIYEHKTFVQGVIWDIYSFDQFGVELGKEIAKNILTSINEHKAEFDSSTELLYRYYQKNK